MVPLFPTLDRPHKAIIFFTVTLPKLHNVPGVRRRPQKYQETRRAVPGVRTSRLLCAEHAEHKGTLSFGSSSMRPAIPSHLCLRSGIKADTIVYFLGFIFFKHLTIVSVSRQMVDACGRVSDHRTFALRGVLPGSLPFRLAGFWLFSFSARNEVDAKWQN